ncbi:MAG: hypothetical protein GVY07_10810 [Bacteroidetes bacterium]|jgi:hypothetical protein|nr:hypothetical protein [Bacteroidota bacterium]
MGTSKEEESVDKNVDNKQSRWFFVGMAVFLILIVVLGFGSTYGLQLLTGSEISGAGIVETDWVIHIHAFVFVGWMLLLLTQTVFVAKGETDVHMAIGKTVGFGLAVAVLIAGSLITYEQIQAAVSQGFVTWAEWPIILINSMQSWMALLLFAGFLGLGLRNRKHPQVHKRYMMFATIMLVFAATSRMEYLLGPWYNTIGMGLMVAPFYIYDLYTSGRVYNATWVGTGGAVVSLIIQYLFG